MQFVSSLKGIVLFTVFMLMASWGRFGCADSSSGGSGADFNASLYYTKTEIDNLFAQSNEFNFDNANSGTPPGPHVRTEKMVDYYLNAEANSITEKAVRDTFDRWGKVTHFCFVYKGRHRAGLRKDGKTPSRFCCGGPPTYR